MFTFLSDNFIGGGHQVITISNSVVSLFADYLTLVKPTSGTFSGKQASGVRISVITSGVYYTFNGTDPVTDGSAGHPLEVGTIMDVSGWLNVKLLKFIRQGAADGAIVVTPYFTSVGVTVPDPS